MREMHSKRTPGVTTDCICNATHTTANGPSRYTSWVSVSIVHEHRKVSLQDGVAIKSQTSPSVLGHVYVKVNLICRTYASGHVRVSVRPHAFYTSTLERRNTFQNFFPNL